MKKTYHDLVIRQIPDPKLAQATPQSEPLAGMSYTRELKLKNKALSDFLKHFGFGDLVPELIPAVQPRNYRTTSKRRVRETKGKFELFSNTGKTKDGLWSSTLEPSQHQEVYQWVIQWINEPRNQFIARRLNWIVLRGHDPNRLHLIFNIGKLDASSVKAFKSLGKRIEQEVKNVVGASTFLDPTLSDYYFEANAVDAQKALKPIFGQAYLEHFFEDINWRFPITGFSQINQKAMPQFVEIVKEMLQPSKEFDLLDMYCGYGFFSMSLRNLINNSLGIDYAGSSIEVARQNLKHQKIQNIRLLSRDLTRQAIDSLPAPKGPELILLDPPRQGTAKGVIEALASRHAPRVLHIFCGIETLPKALKEWEEAGYKPSRIEAIDLFPGTTGIEVLVLLEPLLDSNI